MNPFLLPHHGTGCLHFPRYNLYRSVLYVTDRLNICAAPDNSIKPKYFSWFIGKSIKHWSYCASFLYLTIFLNYSHGCWHIYNITKLLQCRIVFLSFWKTFTEEMFISYCLPFLLMYTFFLCFCSFTRITFGTECEQMTSILLILYLMLIEALSHILGHILAD